MILSITAHAADFEPNIAAASDQGERAISRFATVDGFEVELFAAEPMLANPVCFYIAHDGKVYVAETFRHHHGVTDMREHTEWLLDDLASRNNDDRLAAMKKNLGDDFASYSEAEDRVRLIEDTDGDGKADRATVFAGGFNDALAGIGAGLLADRGDVYFTCIPELWKLRDNDGDGVADTREVLSDGYGVHINFLGHDLHGLRKGPDGRIYFSIGDRGLYVETPDGRVIDDPDTGSVLRCNPDGTGLEIVHRGLRNPQELAFDDYGNLFTGDNNSDAGDQARWVYIVDGGDSGWRIGYQWISRPNPRGPWNAEKMWHPYHQSQPAHILPPLANIGAGPSGLAYYPGTGLPGRYNQHFFMCDFRGSAQISLIHAFRVEPKGAAFELVGRHDFINHVLATDVDFGVDGGIYLSDWVQGWEQPLKGRIYRMFAPELENDPLIAETKRLLAEGMAHRSPDELLRFFEHADQRVRFEAQYALADKGAEAIPLLTRRAADPNHRLARLHGIWGLWQLALAGERMAEQLLPLLDDGDAEVRAQTAKIWSDVPDGRGEDLLLLLNDEADRVRFFAALSLGANPPRRAENAVQGLVEMLRVNDDHDPYLRHAAVMGLAGCAKPRRLATLANDESPAVRLGGLLALRRMQHRNVEDFLEDADPYIVAEAIRAINDEPIPAAYPALAELSVTHAALLDAEPYLARRVLNAHVRLGKPENAFAVQLFASRQSMDEKARVEAVEHLQHWAGPHQLDAITGAWDLRPERDASPARKEFAGGAFHHLLQGDSDAVNLASIRLASHYKVLETEPILEGFVRDRYHPEDARIEALHALVAMQIPRLPQIIKDSLESKVLDDAPALRLEALAELARTDADHAVPLLAKSVETGTTSEKRRAMRILGEIDDDSAAQVVATWFDRFRAGEIDRSAALEIVEAARVSKNPDIKQQFAEYDASLVSADPIDRYTPALEGGNSREGRTIFFEKIETSCVRCHIIGGQGGGEVGPDLSEIGARLTREQILEAIALPSRTIADGYESVLVSTTDGVDYIGRVIEETDDALVIEVPESDIAMMDDDPFAEKAHSIVDVVADDSGDLPAADTVQYVRIRLPRASVNTVHRGLSSMPEDLIDRLTLHELRDLVEYLASRR